MGRAQRIGSALSLLLVLPGTGIWGQAFLDSTAQDIQRLNTQSDPPTALRPFGAPAVWALTRLFYAERSYQPAWTKDGDRTRIATLLDRLDALGELGIEPAVQQTGRIRSMAAGPASPERTALVDIAATMAWLRTGMALSVGRLSPAGVDTLWAPGSSHLDLVDRLQVAVDSDRIATAFDSLPPPQEDAVRLRQALARYQAIAASGGWPVLPRGPALALGATGQRVAVLRRRLETSSDLPTGGSDSVFDLVLDSAVRRAQSRHGLTVDGVLGAATRAALNVPVGSRVLQLEMNLERWRWMPRSLGARYVMVNSAGFALELVDTGAGVFHSRVVNGRVDWPTPIVSGVLTDITFHPRWNIPHDIAALEILPAIRCDTGFLARERIHVMSDTTGNAVELDGRAIVWDSVTDAFPYRFWQEPGPRNPLGRLRFGFANRYGIALHDTPSPELFTALSRAFSHGCVRVADAAGLARLLLHDLPGWGAESLSVALADTVERHLALPDPIPVYVDYWTAWADADGTVEFRPDVYGWDAKLAAALRRRARRP